MGLSASQARLLSITRRLNNNELQSEFISNSKIQLANQNVKASEKYINALSATKMEYISYNQTGIKENVALTFNALTQYDPLKNQYLLYNSEEQIFVNAEDAANFEKSDDLYDFLNCYGLFDRGKAEFAQEDAAYKADHTNWEKERDDYYAYMADFNAENTPEWIQYNSDKANWIANQWSTYYSSQAYIDYTTAKNDYDESVAAGDPYTIFSGIVGTSDAPQSCYSVALSNPLGNCYKHVLGYLINPGAAKDFPTSAGDTVNIGSGDVSGSTLAGDGKGQEIANSMGAVINKTYTSNGEPIMVCDGDDDINTDGEQNILQAARESGSTPSKLQTLMSDFIETDNGDGTYSYSLKSVLQKAIDMMYIIKNQSEFGSELTSAKMYDLLVNFTDGDLKNTPKLPTPPPEPDLNYPVGEPQPLKSLRDEPLPPEETLKIYDKPLAQWYTNLWYAMNGMSDSDEVYSTSNDKAEFDYYAVTNAEKTADKKANFVILEDNLASDSNWLQFAITNGTVTISQATLSTQGDINWQGIEYSSTSDIIEVEDSDKIALAEAEYEKTVKEIQREDKKFDQKIRKLDSEHSALEKELESIKGVMDKNVERSFAAFS